MSVANTKPLDDLATQIRQKGTENVSLSDVVRLAEISTAAFQSFFAAMDSAVLREMREIADYITSMKREIGSLQVNDIKNAHIPAAGQELSAIVKATEAATNTIMNCAEAVMAADASDPAAYKALVDDKMMVIFEACSFQDITGQRVAKVVETLQHIEVRVTRFAHAVRTPDIAGPLTEQEAKRAERKARLLLNGPQLEGDGVKQNDVDHLLGADGKAAAQPLKATNSQDDIDALFN
jgi:chemotaxis protein CheZ